MPSNTNIARHGGGSERRYNKCNNKQKKVRCNDTGKASKVEKESEKELTKFFYKQKTRIPSLQGTTPMKSSRVKTKVTTSSAEEQKKQLRPLRESNKRLEKKHGGKSIPSLRETKKKRSQLIAPREVHRGNDCQKHRGKDSVLQSKGPTEGCKDSKENKICSPGRVSVFDRLYEARKKESPSQRFRPFDIDNIDGATNIALERMERRLNYSPPKHVWTPEKQRNQSRYSKLCLPKSPVFDRLYNNTKREQTLWTDPHQNTENTKNKLQLGSASKSKQTKRSINTDQSSHPWEHLEEEIAANMMVNISIADFTTSSEHSSEDSLNESCNMITTIDSLVDDYESLLVEYDRIQSIQEECDRGTNEIGKTANMDNTQSTFLLDKVNVVCRNRRMSSSNPQEDSGTIPNFVFLR